MATKSKDTEEEKNVTAENQKGASAEEVKSVQEATASDYTTELVELGSTKAVPAPGRYANYPEGSPPEGDEGFKAAHFQKGA